MGLPLRIFAGNGIGGWCLRLFLFGSLILLLRPLIFYSNTTMKKLKTEYPIYHRHLSALKRNFYYTMDAQLGGIRNVVLINRPCFAASDNFLTLMGQNWYLKERNINVLSDICFPLSNNAHDSLPTFNNGSDLFNPLYFAVLNAATPARFTFHLFNHVMDSVVPFDEAKKFKVRSFPINYAEYADDECQLALKKIRPIPDKYLVSTRVLSDSRYLELSGAVVAFAPDASSSLLFELADIKQHKKTSADILIFLSKDHNLPVSFYDNYKLKYTLHFWQPPSFPDSSTIDDQAKLLFDYVVSQVVKYPYFVTDIYQIHLLGVYLNLKHVYLLENDDVEDAYYERQWMQAFQRKNVVAVAEELQTALRIIEQWKQL
ncbi:PvGal biosynthesis protein Pvg5 [Schizosaccharomyces pombe]|uniref:Pyruvylated Gal-beta-1,3-epitope synthesis protein 5 n=1 Tax=Schizosaccharomyces pombe (strain 972 / ATCC 24843) TaxID=284812 RepID=PVG5_SCHPO|nr:PvGal biosynthesis protein Pvg5 [Schizosaccharomyces pombe]Q9UUJ0.1 RecName: Full=Pyruvylated Gal-beta-1,3-epitope synthesis protein 5; Short=PvGal synthesis protein 5; AltName: Full=Meiotically up-regulated gene 50 protein [Schizosaccharomyces pombe 972h-]CAB52712.1 PvGal biosynthesis protein Pvg5 [Schizosaccharomyces pombe]|eukprot:NP_594725.1 PvGal biosynthesis protein Pvg5 [Schizosaccharomyces pombe]